MARVFALDVLECPRCGSRMRILAAIEDPVEARKVLDYLGLASRPPPLAPARRNPRPQRAEFWRRTGRLRQGVLPGRMVPALLDDRPVQILVQPGQVLFRMPEIRFSRLRLPDLCQFPDLCP